MAFNVRKSWYSLGEPIFEKKLVQHMMGVLSLCVMVTSMVSLAWSLQAFYDEHMLWAYGWSLASWCVAWIAWMIKPNA